MAECFGHAGIEYTEEQLTAAAFPFPVQRGRGGMRVGAVEAAAERGALPEAGAAISAIAGKADVRPDAFLRERKPGDKVMVTWLKDGAPRETEVTLVARQTMVPHLRLLDSPTELQRRIREGWLTGK
jgi:hypothetical protein